MKGIVSDIKGQLGSLGKQLGQSVLDESKKAAKTAVSQIGIEIKEGEKKKELPSEVLNAAKQQPELAGEVKNDNADFVNELYGKTEQKPSEADAKTQYAKAAQKMAEENPQKSPEEIQKLMALRQQLHGEYYQKLVRRPGQQEERPVEKIEREKEEEQFELQKKEKKKPKPLAVQQGANKAERFPGVSG